MPKADEAKKLFTCGANCAQSVFCAFAKEMDLDEEMAMKISSSFGGGMGRLREVCGAVSGMFLVAGALKGYSNVSDKEQKDNHYKLIQALAAKFKEENHSIICRELLGLDRKQQNSPVSEARTQEYYKKRPCAELVADAARIIEEALKNGN